MREHFPDFGARDTNRPRPCRWLLPVAPRCGGKFVLLPKKFGKRGGVFRILMPTAPTRTKLSPAQSDETLPRSSWRYSHIFYCPRPFW